VPLTVFTPVVVTPSPLTVRLLADEFRYGVKSFIRLELVNPNQYACQKVHAEVLTPNVEAGSVVVGDLNALSQTEVQIEARIRRVTEEMTALQVRVGYEFLGQPHSQVVGLPVKMKRIMTTTFDLGLPGQASFHHRRRPGSRWRATPSRQQDVGAVERQALGATPPARPLPDPPL
jgi:hypothetical protein